MEVVKVVRGPLWVDGQITVRVRGPGSSTARTFRVRRPFAWIGRMSGADLRIDDPAVADRHAFLILDRRGLFGVDLLSPTGTRFAAEATPCAWLGPGDVIEIAGRWIEILQLKVDGQIIDPPLSNDDPFAEVHASELPALTLEPLDVPGPPWMLGSALAFLGSGDACVIKLIQAEIATTHCAFYRTPTQNYVIDLSGRQTLINDQTFDGASMLVDGDVLTIGRSRFLVKVDDSSLQIMSKSQSTELALNPREALVALIRDSTDPTSHESGPEILEVLRQFQSDTATLFEAQLERIDTLNREIALLRDEVRGRREPAPPPATPLRLNLAPPSTVATDESASWLLDRINTLETESQTTWRELLGKITSTLSPRSTTEPGRSIVPTRLGTAPEDQI